MRIAVAGFQHETNTGAPTPTTLADFEQADSWPALLVGQDVIDETQGMNLPIAGFISAAEGEHEILPILWCSAEPGGRVTDDAFDVISERILQSLSKFDRPDAIYLDLHGAMVTQSHDDGEGELLTRIRRAIGPETPLIASLDLHANITAEIVKLADAIAIYRTYPHLDMAETGERAFRMLQALMQEGRPCKSFRQGAYLIPLHAQHTGAEPAAGLYSALDRYDGAAGPLVELALGFTAADIRDVGPSVIAYAPTQEEADALADEALVRLAAAESDFDFGLFSAEDAVAHAIAVAAEKPVVIADVQDNPGAGAGSDTTGILAELVAQGATETLLGLIYDPALARQAHEAGEAATFEAEIGGHASGHAPFIASVSVLKLSDGEVPYTGAMYGGGVATFGPSAALSIEDTEIKFVVTSIRNQCLDLAQFRHFGLEPTEAKIVCVKSTAHFRADFEPIVDRVLATAAPGLFPCRLSPDQFTKIRPGVRI
ncbi:MAG: M81 family metallopeptidase [Pseudomonadota bacterium]